MYVRACIHTYLSVTLRNVNLCSHARRWTHVSHALTHEDTGCANMPSDGGQGRTALLDNRGWVGQSGWSSATYVFCGVESECSQQLAAFRKTTYCNWLMDDIRSHPCQASVSPLSRLLTNIQQAQVQVDFIDLNGCPWTKDTAVNLLIRTPWLYWAWDLLITVTWAWIVN